MGWGGVGWGGKRGVKHTIKDKIEVWNDVHEDPRDAFDCWHHACDQILNCHLVLICCMGKTK